MADTDLLFSRPARAPGMPVELVFGETDAAPVKRTGNLLFRDPPNPRGMPVELVFELDAEEEAPAPDIPDVEVQAGGQITGIRAALLLSAAVQATAAGRITGIRQPIGARYDINLFRSTVAATNALWQDAKPITASIAARYREAVRTPASTRTVWQNADTLRAGHTVNWQDAQQRQRRVGVVFEQAQRLPTAPNTVRFEQAITLRNATAAAFQQAIRTPTAPATRRYQESYRDRQVQARRAFEQARSHSTPFAAGMGNAITITLGFDGRFEQAWSPRPGRSTKPPPPAAPPCYLPALPASLLFDDLADSSLPAHLLFFCEGQPGPGPVDPQPGQIIVPIRGVYMTVNNLSLTRVQGSIPMPATAFFMSLDADSWTWQWSATCTGAALDLLAPGSGNPVEMEAEINGVKYRLFAEDVSRSRSFGTHTVQVTGRGLAAELDKPYAPVLNFTSAVDRTAQQLAADALQINGVGIGWGIDWQLTDWLVPGNVWARQGAYIDAVLAIAQAAGGYVQPHRTAKTLRVLHRYPAPPWEWAALAPDIVLPSAPVITEGIRWSGKPAYNRVFVAGEAGGVIGQVTRAGTAGNTVAPMVVDSLITHADAARQRGRAELSNTGQQAAVTLSLPVLPETGLIVPGQLVRYTDGPTTRTGLVRGTSLQWQRPKLRQTIELETHL